MKGPFDVVPQLAYSKTIAKSDKKPPRHFIRSEAFVNEKFIYRKGPDNRANKVLEVGFMGFLYFWLKTKILKRERVLGIEILSKVVFKKLERNKS